MIQLPIETEEDVIMAATLGKSIARDMGFSLVDQTKIAVSISELTRNVINYANRGKIRIHDKDTYLEIIVEDSGPGIEDVVEAMKDGVTTGKGLGLGLSGTKRLMDEFILQTEVGIGTTITIKKWLEVESN
ncbi:ATP-binding protein [Aneurinibacillus sp. Ricciae_BoGa-3]|uniref:ATP-binding protein n=1 Tax=Aneurinibacillus sp. Ricciae_BoGa-3 TaxID=3022697 RepID=UPI002341AA74|nr:ATP-binding protein [Aneurinibacillus sp. Ricciae_BoGa-3]WCK55842.1 ATP-binding protein [Aneurinibacillus sp. Ricciae_BoGa-3]